MGARRSAPGGVSLALAERVRVRPMRAYRALAPPEPGAVSVPQLPAPGLAGSGTILASTKLPLRTWFLAMYLMTQTKNGISALELSRQISVSYNTAWKVKHKLMQVMKERDDTRPLGGWVQLDDAYWGGQRHGGKSGRGAPGKTPFVAAVELNAQGRPMRMRLSRVGGFRSEEIGAWARCQLEPGTVVVSDALGCFGAVEQARCIHQPFVTGSGPKSAQHPALTWVNRCWATSSAPFMARTISSVPSIYRATLPSSPTASAAVSRSGRCFPASRSSPCEPRPCPTVAQVGREPEPDALGT